MLRGCAHGDLHGRNILVGCVRDRVLWPAVFDYEDMSPCRLLGWDFVKMETELKIRAYPEVYTDQEGNFLQAVQDDEIELAAKTEAHYYDRSWPDVPEGKTPSERLQAILLQ